MVFRNTYIFGVEQNEMNCNGGGHSLFVVILFTLICVMVKWCNGMYRIDWNNKNMEESKKESIGHGEYGNYFENDDNEILYDIPSEDNRISEEKTLAKRSTIENCLYEELKRRVDKFNNELAKNPNTALKNHIDDLIESNQKHSTVRACLYEAYKKRLDAITNELVMDEEDPSRTGRSSPLLHHTYADLARRLQLLSQTLQPEYNSNLSPSPLVEIKRHSSSLVPVSQSFDYDDRLVEDNDLGNNEEDEVAYDDDNSRLFVQVPAVNAASSSAGGSSTSEINASTYPTVLTKAFETNMNPISNTSPGNLLATVAKKMNTTTLELAQKLTNLTESDTAAMSQDPNLTATLQKYITNAVGVNTTLSQAPVIKQEKVASKPSQDQVSLKSNETNKREEARQPKSAMNLFSFKGSSSDKKNSSDDECVEEKDKEKEKDKPKNVTEAQCNMNPIMENNSEMSEEQSNRITMILEKVLSKLENLEAKKENSTARKSGSSSLEGAPCELLGSWHSLGMGVRFDISLGKANERQLATAEEGNKLLSITVEECIPPKRKRIVDTDWKFMGSGIQQLGGPFYMYSQRRKEKILATFTGYCRTCGGIDTIFGSWTFLFPSKDCQDISAAIDNRRDIFRRYKMEVKRKQRFKELLYKNSKMGKTESCKDKES